MMNFADILPTLSAAITPTTGSEVTRNVAEQLAAKYRSGANMDCLVFDDAVVKWVRQGNYHVSAGEDVEFYASVEEQDKKFFASCVSNGMFIIQERVEPMIEYWRKTDKMTQDNMLEMLVQIAKMGAKYNLMDLHSGNVGFRKDDTSFTPVIFDYSGRRNWKDLIATERHHGLTLAQTLFSVVNLMAVPTEFLLLGTVDEFNDLAVDELIPMFS